MNENENQNVQSEAETEEELKQKVLEIQGMVSDGINKTMTSTAEYLDKTADKFRTTASFFRNKNADSLKGDVTEFTKKYPAQTLIGAIVIGFLFGKIISK